MWLTRHGAAPLQLLLTGWPMAAALKASAAAPSHASRAAILPHTASRSCQASAFTAGSQWQHQAWKLAAGGAALGTAGLLSTSLMMPADAQAEAEAPKAWPVYTATEVAKHTTPDAGIWVTFKEGVYDITEFVGMHPGGVSKIMLAAGASVEPFWALYQQHLKAEVQEMLKDYRIGSLEGYKAGQSESSVAEDPWKHEPSRHPALIYRSERPANAETPGHILAANLVTPTDIFYVRNHLPVPVSDPSSWRLVIEGEGLRRMELSLDELRDNFKKHTLAATVQCAGNRRNELKAVRPVKGLDWDTGAIGTAMWGGVWLVDVLQAAGLDFENPQALHIQFVGADADPVSGDTYGASIPVEMAAAPNREVLLAYEMNGAALTPDHGFPLRVVVPGVVGARSVKWLSKVVGSRKESGSHWQQHDYKSFSPSTNWDTVDWDSAPSIQESPVTSAITEPVPGARLPKHSKSVKVCGYAWSGGGRDVVRVDVSADGGKSWHTAQLKKLPQGWGKADVPLPANVSGKVQLLAKSVDSSYNSQPDSVEGIWNLRGCVNNAWHRVDIHVES